MAATDVGSRLWFNLWQINAEASALRIWRERKETTISFHHKYFPEAPKTVTRSARFTGSECFPQLLPKPSEKLEHHIIAAPVANMYLAPICLTTAFN